MVSTAESYLQSAEADFVCVDAVETAESYLQSAEADFVCVDAVSTAEFQPPNLTFPRF